MQPRLFALLGVVLHELTRSTLKESWAALRSKSGSSASCEFNISQLIEHRAPDKSQPIISGDPAECLCNCSCPDLEDLSSNFSSTTAVLTESIATVSGLASASSGLLGLLGGVLVGRSLKRDVSNGGGSRRKGRGVLEEA